MLSSLTKYQYGDLIGDAHRNGEIINSLHQILHNRIVESEHTHTNRGGDTMLYYLSYVIGMLRILAAEYEPEEGEE